MGKKSSNRLSASLLRMAKDTLADVSKPAHVRLVVAKGLADTVERLPKRAGKPATKKEFRRALEQLREEEQEQEQERPANVVPLIRASIFD